VLRLSAIDGAGNACVLSFARSAAWAERERSVAPASAAVGAPEGERPPTSGRFRARSAFRWQHLTAPRGQRLDAPFGAPPPFSFAGRRIFLLRGGEQKLGRVRAARALRPCEPTGSARSGRPDDRLREAISSATTFARASGLLRRLRSASASNSADALRRLPPVNPVQQPDTTRLLPLDR